VTVSAKAIDAGRHTDAMAAASIAGRTLFATRVVSFICFIPSVSMANLWAPNCHGPQTGASRGAEIFALLALVLCTRASDQKVDTGFWKNPMLKQKTRA
jgi:hypothetical protein